MAASSLAICALEQLEPRTAQRLDQRRLVPGGLKLNRAALEHRLLAGHHQLLQRRLRRARRLIGRGLGESAKIVERLRVDRIGLRPPAQAAGKVAHLAWIGHGDGHPGGVCGGDQRAVARARRFADQMSAAWQLGQKPAVARRRIGQAAVQLRAVVIEFFLGEIDAEVDGMG